MSDRMPKLSVYDPHHGLPWWGSLEVKQFDISGQNLKLCSNSWKVVKVWMQKTGHSNSAQSFVPWATPHSVQFLENSRQKTVRIRSCLPLLRSLRPGKWESNQVEIHRNLGDKMRQSRMAKLLLLRSLLPLLRSVFLWDTHRDLLCHRFCRDHSLLVLALGPVAWWGTLSALACDWNINRGMNQNCWPLPGDVSDSGSHKKSI